MRPLRTGLLALVGAALLWIGLPPSSVDTLENLRAIDRGTTTVIRIALGPDGPAVVLSSTALLLFLGVLAVLLALHAVTTFNIARRALHFLRQSRIGAGIAMLWTTLFMATLLPGRTGGIESTGMISLGILWNTLGVWAIGMAIAPMISRMSKSDRLSGMLSRSYDRIHAFVFGSPTPVFLGVLATFVFSAALLGSEMLFGRIPHVQDSIAQLFQAKIFATGHLVAPIPGHREFFTYTHMIMDGGWYSQFPPGHAAILFLGVLAGVPWVVNPLLGAASILVMYLLGREIYGTTTGRLGALLLALSPFVILMSSEFMNHSTGMVMFSIFVWSGFLTVRKPTIFTGVLAGTSLGWFMLTRPFSAAALAAPFLAYGAFLVWKGGKQMRRAAIGACLMLAVFLGLFLYYNYATTGDPLMSGYEKRYGAGTNPGFGHSAWGVSHTPTIGMLQTFSNLNLLNKALFEWPVSSLLFCAFLFASGWKGRRELLLLLPTILVSIAYFFYWFQDRCFGPRYLYEAAPLIVLLTARGVERCVQLITEAIGTGVERWKVSCSMAGFLAILFAVGWTVNLPPVVNEMKNSYWRVDQHLVQEVRARGISNAVVFVSGNYGSAFSENDPLLSGRVIYAKDLREENEILMGEYPGRSYYSYREGSLNPLSGPREPSPNIKP